MHERPPDLTDAELADALARHWDLAAARLAYVPAGFGGYHWAAGDRAGRPWFITATRIATEAALADLSATMTMAARLAAGHDFVVGPRSDRTGAAACLIRPGWAVTVFPFAPGEPGHFGDPVRASQRAQITGLLARLHASGEGGPARPFALASRPGLEHALRERGRPWPGGLFSGPARALVSEYAAGLDGALAEFDELCAAVTAAGGPVVPTHGEPHPGNLLRDAGRYRLIDWDTAGLAPPERDLCWIASASGAEAARYAGLTGREVSAAGLALYRLRWDLDDAGLLLAGFRSVHDDSEDSRAGWAGLQGAVSRLAAGAWRTAAF